MKNLNEYKEDIFGRLDRIALDLVESDELKEATIKRVNRIRKGKIQRRHVVSGREGYTIRNGKPTRMSAKERRNRKLSQVRGARKRKAKKAVGMRKRKLSLIKRKRIAGAN